MPDTFVRHLIELSKSRYDLDTYRSSDIRLTCRAFEGTPTKHPYDEELMILLSDAFSTMKDYLEIKIDSIGRIDEIGTIADKNGNSAMRVRVWVKKGTPAIRSKPFIVR